MSKEWWRGLGAKIDPIKPLRRKQQGCRVRGANQEKPSYNPPLFNPRAEMYNKEKK